MQTTISPTPPKNSFNKLMIVGDFPGQDDVTFGRPFMGKSGQELTSMLSEAGIDRNSCHLTCAFKQQPHGNTADGFCGKKAEVGGNKYSWPKFGQGKYIRPEYLDQVEILLQEMRSVQPNLVLLLGGLAAWAVLGLPQMSKIRGSIAQAHGFKVLPTYPPATVLRQWNLRTIVGTDLLKASREMKFPEVRVPAYKIFVPDTIAELRQLAAPYLRAKEFSFDIETKNQQITCISFSSDGLNALVVPLASKEREGNRYWSATDEVLARKVIAKLLASPANKLGQNVLYDLQYCWKEGMPVRNLGDDTMLMHHSMYPEMPKGLAFLGSIYTNAPTWKELRLKGTERKADE